MGSFVQVVILILTTLVSAQVAAAEKVALVLSGGGARGAAHIGVLRELERRQVRPDLIVGVSFGALVGGLYSSGMALDDIEQLMAELSLAKNFQDRPERALQTYRQKNDNAGNLLNFDVGAGINGIKLPLGLVQGQELSVTLAKVLLPVSNQRDFSQLPIPFVAVATDIETGQAVRLDRGNLATVIKASLAVPVVFAPVSIDGRLLVDGGVANNLPVNVARDLGATQVIAVDASMPRLRADQLTSFVSVVDQITTLLTRANADRQLARLGPNDFLVSPDLDGIGSLDLARAGDAIGAGRAAALADIDWRTLRALDTLPWASWQAERLARFQASQKIDSVTVFNGSRLDGRAIVNQLNFTPGQILQPEQLEQDLRRVYAMGIFERVEADVIEDRQGQKSLEIRTREKAWGPDYLNFGAGVEDNFRGDAAYSFRLSYTATGQNPTGGELKTTLELGRDPSLSVRFYQPIGYGTPWFAEAELYTARRLLRIYDQGLPVAEYLVSDTGIGFDIGRQLSSWGEIRIGLEKSEPRSELQLGTNVLDRADTQAAVTVSFAADTLDSLAFPSSGVRTELSYATSRQKLGAAQDYESAAMRLLVPYSGRYGTVLARLEGGEVLSKDAPPERAFTLGGFTRLSGYSPGELAGSRLGLLSLVAYQPIDSTLGLGQMYRGLSLETGGVFLSDEAISFSDLLNGYSVFIGLDTQLGPLYLSFGASEGGRKSVSLTLGRPLGE